MSEEDLVSNLQSRFCPPLDTATFLAIIFDYDLANSDKLQEAIDALEFISATAAVEEASGFDASGSGGLSCNVLEEPSPVELEHGEDVHSERTGWTSSSPDDGSLSTGVSSIDLEEDSATCIEHDAQLERLDPAEKMAVITSIFPGVTRLDIELALKRCRNNAGKAIEDLLNIVLWEETGSRLRGVEGFSGSDEAGSRRKKGKRRKELLETQDDIGELDSPAAPASKWETANRDIEFISKHSKHPIQQVTSLYHKNGASTPKTILAILNSQQLLNLEYDNPSFDIYESELSLEFPSIPKDKVKALAELTYPTEAAGRELARALSRSDSKEKSGGIKIEWRLPPPPDLSPSIPSKLNLPCSLYPTSLPTTPTFLPPRTATEARFLREKSLIKANNAYRKGNSTNYQGAVAAHYASEAREYGGVMRMRGSEEAEQLVSETRWQGGMDLHGVGVKDAVRIARDGVTEWWAGRRRREEEGRGRHEPYRIVTGLGRHSVGGAKLGPAVGRMLIREGWKVEVGTGVLLVTGVVSGRKK